MKKLYFLVALCLASMSATAGENFPQWLQDIQTQNKGFIDSTAYYDANPMAPETRTYILYFNQPLEHAKPDGPHFPMRALITVFKDNNPTKAINHVYCTGYRLDQSYYENPDSVLKAEVKDCTREIAHRYHANYISIEHRYFGYSSPAECWTNLDPLRAEEAAEDFHDLFVALKKVLKGKWVMSGVSKGGITTLLQHKFHPEDMDLFVPYSAPFFNTDRDLEMQKYWYNNGLTDAWRETFMNIRHQGLGKNSEQIYNIFYKMNAGSINTKEHADSVYGAFITSIPAFGFLDMAYNDTTSLNKQVYKNDSIMRKYGFTEYCDTIYAFMLEKNRFSLDSFGRWIDTLRAYPDYRQQMPRQQALRRFAHTPFGVTKEQWWGKTDKMEDEQAYEYQSKRELGYYDYRFDPLISDPDVAASWNQTYQKYVGACLRNFLNPAFASLTFDRTLYDETMTATKNATKPVLLLYGEDDPWAGAAVKDEFINGTNVQKFILPAQNHSVYFTSNTDQAKCDAIRDFIDKALGSAQGIEEANSDWTRGESRKILRNGQLYILRGDKTYTVQGTEVH